MNRLAALRRSGSLLAVLAVSATALPLVAQDTVTAGIVSLRARDIDAGPCDDVIQTDAPINSGSSGGPLFDASGEGVGVDTAIFAPHGGPIAIGFAVPSAAAERIAADPQDDGRVERGWFGVQMQPIDTALASALGLDAPEGALIAAVKTDSPAVDAGLDPGDILIVPEISAAPVDAPRDRTFAVADLPVGDTVSVSCLRNGNRDRTPVTIGEGSDMCAACASPNAPGDGAQPEPEGPRIGVAVAPLSGDPRAQAGVPDDVSGSPVQTVAQGSPAAQADPRPGDMIVEAAEAMTGQVDTLRGAMSRVAAHEGTLHLRIFRQREYSVVVVDPGDARAAT